MVRICGACRHPLRWDETLQTAFLSHLERPGIYSACPRCVAAGEGYEPAPPAKYPPGSVPRHPTQDRDLPICGLCREALFEHERNRSIRIEPEDLPFGDSAVPGAYSVCPRCWDQYAWLVLARWIRDGLAPAGSTPFDPML